MTVPWNPEAAKFSIDLEDVLPRSSPSTPKTEHIESTTPSSITDKIVTDPKTKRLPRLDRVRLAVAAFVRARWRPCPTPPSSP